MKLSEYLSRDKVRPSHFAAKAGVPVSTIWRIVHEKGDPSLDVIRRISAATNGEVTANDFANSVPPIAAVERPAADGLP